MAAEAGRNRRDNGAPWRPGRYRDIAGGSAGTCPYRWDVYRKGMDVNGVTGDPNRATTEIGRRGMDFSFAAAMDQIQQLLGDDQRHFP